MRSAYGAQLDALRNDLAEMCRLTGLAMERATQALLGADLALAEQVIGDHDGIPAAGVRTEEAGLRLLARQAPIGRDLRMVVSSIQIVADLERMGALALHVAEVARLRHPRHAVPESVDSCFAEMGRMTINLAERGRTLILAQDPSQDESILAESEAMTVLRRRLFAITLGGGWKHGMAAAVDVTLLGRYYQRFADHVEGISRRISVVVPGRNRLEEAFFSPGNSDQWRFKGDG